MEGFLGEVRMFAGTFPPRSWAFCDGSLLPISSYNALFTILGTQFGGDGETNFALPDLRGCVPVGAGSGPGLTHRNMGERSGTENVNLVEEQMPTHTHATQATATGASIGGTATATMKVNNDEAETITPSGNYIGKLGTGQELYIDEATANTLAADAITVDTSGLSVDVTGLSVAINPAGDSQPHNNMQPYVGINYIICIVGVFPSST
ncbi:MAG: hypothetical protein GQ564_12685 [Bacteroidales bacterium]|nr:hypothetical protein [Bacteroidales bacterium]